ncbi:FAD-binding protein, partial [Sutterella wadsworthensis]
RAQTGGVIPGLFAAGEVVGGIFGFDRLGGAGITNCLVMGRIAGERAVEFQSGT